ncbi:YdcF family protein [Pleurocapsales cyanobacterium LEGE 10410]|nr:YdcF family protein [Pleurocapsales cyanobacterium LEGE 10410]
MSFLFLSKLLPLFVYPLGLSCLLLLLALWLCFRRSRWGLVPILISLVILITAGNAKVANQLIASLEQQYLPQENMPQAEAIVILGGATRNQESPRIIPDMNDRGDRLLYGAKLYKDGLAPQIILTGGRIQWYGGDSSEAESMAKILELMGIPREAMILESRSLNTYENAVFTKEILERKNIKQILLVTSAAHMPRSLAIFKKQGINAIAAPADFIVSDRNLTASQSSTEGIILSLIPKAESLDHTTQALKEYIGIFVYRLRGWL